MRDGEPNIYIALATIRNGYIQLQWSRVQSYLVFNIVALPLVFGTGQVENVKFILCLIGIVFHTFIPLAVLRGERWTRYWNKKMAELERLDQQAANKSGSRVLVFSDPRFEAMRTSRIASRKIFAPIAIALEVIWIEEAVRHGLLLVHTGV